MRKLIVLTLVLLVCGVAFAHVTYIGKSHELRRAGHLIEVRLDQNNSVTVFMDNVAIGARTNFCIPSNTQ